MITAATAINILQALSPSEMEKVKTYVLERCNTNQAKQKKTKKNTLLPEYQNVDMIAWLMQQHDTEVIREETKPASQDN